jgi:hypothetical protein
VGHRHTGLWMCANSLTKNSLTDGSVWAIPLHGLHVHRTSRLWISSCGATSRLGFIQKVNDVIELRQDWAGSGFHHARHGSQYLEWN